MKKILSVLMLICLTLSFFSACKTNTIDFEDESDELNFHGSEFTVITTYYSFFKSAGETASNDRFNQRLNDIQNKHGLVFTEKSTFYPEMDCIAGSMTGSFTADLIICPSPHIYEMNKINALIPVDEFFDISGSDKYGTKNILAGSLLGGKYYGIFPYLHDNAPSLEGLLSTDMNEIKEFNLTDPHEIIEAGEWTWENFREFLKEATFSDGDEQYVGLVLSNDRNAQNGYSAFIFSNGGSMTEYSPTEGYRVAFDSPEAIEAMEYITSVFASPYADSPAKKETNYIFKLGPPVFGSDDDEEIHVMPVPYGPKGSPETVSAIMIRATFWTFPIFSMYSSDETAVIINELFEPLSEFYPNGWKEYMADNCFFDDIDYEYYCRAAENAHYIDTAILEEMYATFTHVINGEYTVTAAIESVKDSVQESLDKKYGQ